MTAVREAFEREVLPAFAARFRPGHVVLNIGAGSHDYRAAFPCRVVTSDAQHGCDEMFQAEAIPYPDDAVDGVLMMGVFERLDDPMQAIRELHRVVRPGGFVLLSLLDLGFPWRKDVDPHDIPDGYSPDLHAALADTIAEPGTVNLATLRIMACHESKPRREIPCVGWLANQLGPGNNIGLRYAVARGRLAADFTLVGEQHVTFEDTLPKKR